MKAAELVRKMWPEKIEPAEYERVVTLVTDLARDDLLSEISVPRRAPPPAPRVAKVAAPKRGRPRKNPAAKISSSSLPAMRKKPAVGPKKDSSVGLARRALTGHKLTSKELEEAVGGSSNVYMLISRAGAVEVGVNEAGQKLFTIPAGQAAPAAPVASLKPKEEAPAAQGTPVQPSPAP